MCTKAVSSTNPRQKLRITCPPLRSRVVLMDDPPLPLVGLARRATAIASAITSSLFCRSALLSDSSTVAVARHAGQRQLAAALARRAA